MSSGKRYLNRSRKYDKRSKLPILPIVTSSSANENKVDDITENGDFGIDEYFNEEINNEELQYVEGDDSEQKKDFEDDVGIPQAMDEINERINIWGDDIEAYDSDDSYISHENVVFNAAYEEEETNSEKDEEGIQEVDGFNFKDLLSEVINKLQQQYNEEPGNLAVNEEDLLTPHEDVSTATVANFAQGMAGVFAAYNAENAMIDDVFTCLSNFLPGINWPVKKSRKDVIKNDLSSYVDVDARSLKFDVCGSGCVAFIGETLGKAILCPTCKSPRYKHCSRRACKDKPYGDCKHTDRKSHHVFYYRYCKY
jgi:hypothetical protein